jgi:hypothetical protein
MRLQLTIAGPLDAVCQIDGTAVGDHLYAKSLALGRSSRQQFCDSQGAPSATKSSTPSQCRIGDAVPRLSQSDHAKREIQPHQSYSGYAGAEPTDIRVIECSPNTYPHPDRKSLTYVSRNFSHA